MDVRPVNLKVEGGNKLLIEWSDGQRRAISFGELRKACPCATCREKNKEPETPQASGGLPVLSMAEARPLVIVGMRPVGNYAYGVTFSDGHDTGIYTLELLRALGTEVTG